MTRVAALTLLLAALCIAPAHATMPGSNGKVSFIHDGDVWSIGPDGTGELNVTSNHAVYTQQHDWSPDGTQIAYGNTDIWVINADGTELTAIINTPDSEYSPSWSPDGTRIVYERWVSTPSGTRRQLWIADADGSNPAQLPTSTVNSQQPQWHPDGARIGYMGCNFTPNCIVSPRIINVDGTGEQPLPVWGDFSPDGTQVVFDAAPPGASYPNHDIFIQNLDGTGRTRITDYSGPDREPAWSPDGTKIVFRRSIGPGPRIHTMNADGSDVMLVSDRAGIQPKWQPIPVDSYPRPKGATPLLAFLVPAYAQCDLPNEMHGPPLAFGSCAAPAQASSALTVGTADANGRPAQSVSTVLLETQVGSPATPADEADVRVTASITDVYEQGSLADYAGSLHGKIGLRITDRLSSGPGVAGTTSDTALEFEVPCSSTAATTAGSTCALATSVDALVPGAVPEGKRSIWALGQIEVDDADGAPFMRQGLFVP